MKRIVTTLSTLALALSLGAPVFAAKAPKAPKGNAQTQTATVKSPTKHKVTKKSRKSARKTAKASVKSTTPQQK